MTTLAWQVVCYTSRSENYNWLAVVPVYGICRCLPTLRLSLHRELTRECDLSSTAPSRAVGIC